MSQEQQLQIPPKEVIANSPLMNRCGPDFQYPSKVELPNQKDPSLPHMVLTLCPMSELSTYHIDSLLEYGKTGIRNKQHKVRSPTRKTVRKNPASLSRNFISFRNCQQSYSQKFSSWRSYRNIDACY